MLRSMQQCTDLVALATFVERDLDQLLASLTRPGNKTQRVVFSTALRELKKRLHPAELVGTFSRYK